MSGGPYPVSYGKYNTSECLPFGIYSYNIFDSHGDGLSQCFKDGSSCGNSVTINNHTILSNDGSFTLEQSQAFGICLIDAHCDDGDPCTHDTCDALSRVCRYDLECSKCNKVAATIVTDTDLNPYYFSWILLNKESVTIASMGPFQKSYTKYEHTECLQEGQYTLTVFDTYQDGLTKCYDNNMCGYYVSVDNIVLFEGGDENLQEKNHIFNIGLSTDSQSFPPTSTESPIGGTPSPVDNTFAPTTTQTMLFTPTSTQSNEPISTSAPTFLKTPPTQYPTERPPTPYPTETPPTPHPTQIPPTPEPTYTPPTHHPTQKAPTPYPTETPPTPYPTESLATPYPTSLNNLRGEGFTGMPSTFPTESPKTCKKYKEPCASNFDCCSDRCHRRGKYCKAPK